MIEQNATVVSQDKEFVWVQTERKSTCGQCAVQKGCGTAVLSEYFRARSQAVAVLKTLSVSEGDKVVIGLEEEALIRGSLAVYSLPLVFMFVAGLVGETLSSQLLIESEGLTVTFSLLGLLLGAIWLRRFGLSVKFDKRYQPVLLRHSE